MTDTQQYDPLKDWRCLNVLNCRIRWESLERASAWDNATNQRIFADEVDEETAKKYDFQHTLTLLLPKNAQGGVDVQAVYMEETKNAKDVFEHIKLNLLAEHLGGFDQANGYFLNQHNFAFKDMDQDNKEDLKGNFIVRAKSKRAPLVIGKAPELYMDADGNTKPSHECWSIMRKQKPPQAPYAGCFANVLLTMWRKDPGGRGNDGQPIPLGIYARITAVQFMGDGPEFNMGQAKATVFKDVRTEEDKAADQAIANNSFGPTTNNLGPNGGNGQNAGPNQDSGASGPKTFIPSCL